MRGRSAFGRGAGRSGAETEERGDAKRRGRGRGRETLKKEQQYNYEDNFIYLLS